MTQGETGLLMREGSVLRTIRAAHDGLPPDGLRDLLFDREGSLWVASRGQGAFQSIGFGHWEHWDRDDGLPDSMIWSVGRASAGGPLWVSSDLGTVPLGPTGAPGQPEIPGTNHLLAATRGGRIWLAPAGGPLVRIGRDGRTLERFAAVDGADSGIVDGRNRLWLGTGDGIVTVDDADASAPLVRPREVLRCGRVHDATLDPDGRPVFLTETGLWRLEESGAWTRLVERSALPPSSRMVVFVSRNELWIGASSTGITRFAIGNGRGLTVLRPVTTPTIGSNSLMFLHRDRLGAVWVGTDRGIDRLDGRGWTHFDAGNGPLTGDMDEGADFEDGDGSLWFGTSLGLSHLTGPIDLAARHALHPVIRDARLGTRPLPPDRNAHVDWSRDEFQIGFGALDLAESHISYLYRLRGRDPGWTEISERVVHCFELPVGKLHFEVIAQDLMAGESSAPVDYTIDVRAP